MAGNKTLPPKTSETTPFDINELLDRDEEIQYRSPIRGKAQLVDSDGDQSNDGDEVNLEDEEDSEEIEAEEEARTFYHNLDDEEMLDEAALLPPYLLQIHTLTPQYLTQN